MRIGKGIAIGLSETECQGIRHRVKGCRYRVVVCMYVYTILLRIMVRTMNTFDFVCDLRPLCLPLSVNVVTSSISCHSVLLAGFAS